MKNVFKKTAALVSAMSLMAVGTAVSVSASAEKPELELEATALTAKSTADYNTYAVKPGEEVKVQVAVLNSEGAKYDTISFRHLLKDGLTVSKVTNEVNKKITADLVQVNQSYADEVEVDDANFVVCTYTVVIPADAAGKEIIFDWADPSSYEFNLINTHVDSSKSMDYSTKGIKFVVEGEVTTVVTTTEAPVTTTTVTTKATDAPVTTVTTKATDAPATTKATTTVTSEAVTTSASASETTVETSAVSTSAVSTSAVSTSKVSAQPASPATGSSSNGVAALAVTMVAAAGAAIALKKKKD